MAPNRKRKRDQDARNAPTDRSEIISRKIHYLRNSFHRAAKKAKNYEIQRQTKRLRAARQEGMNGFEQKLSIEMKALKDLNVKQVADSYLSKVVIKNRALMAVEYLQPLLPVNELVAKGSTTINNLVARLYNSTVLKSCATEAVTLLELSCGLRERRQLSPKPSPIPNVDEDESEQILGSNDGDSVEFESGETDEADIERATSKHAIGNSLLESKPSISSTQFFGPVEDMEQAFSDGKPTARLKVDDTLQKSKLLPSLAAGYISGSESDDTNMEPSVRTNRRGQRARRAIWEKKYGRGANHLRGSTHPDRARRIDTKGVPATTKGYKPPAFKEQIHHKATPPAAPQIDKPLHPSWEARKKNQERTAKTEFQGKKIVF